MRRLLALSAIGLLVLVAGGAAADTFAVHLVSQNNTTITLGWTPQPGYGYLFSANGALVSRTNDPSRNSVKFAKVTPASYDIDVIVKGANGHYPAAAPPPPKAACENGLDDDADGKVDLADPGCSSATDNDEKDPVVPKPQCSDTTDNDADGKIDYPADPGCSSATDTDETDPAPPTGAQVYISPSGNDTASCAQTAPCRTFTRGYQAAASGNTVSVAAGSYGGFTLGGSKTVTFRAAGGVSVTDRLTLRDLSNATFVGPITMTQPGEQDWALIVEGASNNLTLDNLSGSHFTIQECASNILMRGGSWGGYTNRPWAGDSMIGGDASQSCGIVRNVTLDGVRFHDVQYVDSSQWGGGHPDCLESHGAIQNLVIRNSVFERCGNTFIGTYLDWGNMDGLLIENNTFFQTTDDTYYGVQLGYKPGKTCAGLVFRNNRYDPNAPNAAYAHAPPLIDNCADTGTGSVTQVYGNTFRRGPGPSCPTGDWHDNVFETAGSGCGTGIVYRPR